MDLPTYSGNSQIKTNVYNFYGINRTRRGTKGELEDMKNMSTLEYPCAAPRGKRKGLAIDIEGSDIQAVVSPDRTNVDEITGLTGITGDRFYYNGIEKGDLTEYSGCEYEIIRLANLYIINCYADKNKANVFYYNVDTDKFDTVVSFMKHLILHCEGNSISTYRYATSDPYTTSYYKDVYYYEVEGENGIKYSNRDFFDNYKYYSSDNIFESFGFSVGDEVILSGFPTADENIGQVWYVDPTSNVSKHVLSVSGGYDENNVIDLDDIVDENTLPDNAIVKAVISGFRVTKSSINGLIVYTHTVEFNLENKNGKSISFSDMIASRDSAVYCTGITMYNASMRKFTHICAHNNSLWGTSANGNFIYSTSTDGLFRLSATDISNGYADKKQVDTPGYFTGMCEYGSELIVFKDESISIVFGSDVGEYGISNIYGIGCIDGRSIASTQSGIIFLGYKGFYLFNGNNSSLISTRLNTKYTECIAGYDGQIYYASAKRLTDGKWEFLTYDMRYSTWHIQDDIEAVGFFPFKGEFYIADKDSIYRIDDDTSNEIVEWEFTAYRTHDNTLNMKALDEVWIRAEVADGAEFTVYTDMDNLGFVEHTTFNKPGLNIYRCQVRTLSGSYYRYKIVGKGNVVFYEIELQKSSDGRKYMEKENTTYHKPIEDKFFDGDY